jgi:hypothetical protein
MVRGELLQMVAHAYDRNPTPVQDPAELLPEDQTTEGHKPCRESAEDSLDVWLQLKRRCRPVQHIAPLCSTLPPRSCMRARNSWLTKSLPQSGTSVPIILGSAQGSRAPTAPDQTPLSRVVISTGLALLEPDDPVVPEICLLADGLEQALQDAGVVGMENTQAAKLPTHASSSRRRRGGSQEKSGREHLSSSCIRKTTNLIGTSTSPHSDPNKGAHRQTNHLLPCRIQ